LTISIRLAQLVSALPAKNSETYSKEPEADREFFTLLETSTKLPSKLQNRKWFDDVERSPMEFIGLSLLCQSGSYFHSHEPERFGLLSLLREYMAPLVWDSTIQKFARPELAAERKYEYDEARHRADLKIEAFLLEVTQYQKPVRFKN
jgi:hypothetical protein